MHFVGVEFPPLRPRLQMATLLTMPPRGYTRRVECQKCSPAPQAEAKQLQLESVLVKP